MNWLTRFFSDDLAKLLLRLGVGGLMLLHGIGKIRNGVAGIAQDLQGLNVPGVVAYGVYVGEVVAPLLILLGVFTRPSGLLVSFTMVVAIALKHRSDVFNLAPHGGSAIELPLLFLLGGLALFFGGGGRFSLARGRGTWD